MRIQRVLPSLLAAACLWAAPVLAAETPRRLELTSCQKPGMPAEARGGLRKPFRIFRLPEGSARGRAISITDSEMPSGRGGSSLTLCETTGCFKNSLSVTLRFGVGDVFPDLLASFGMHASMRLSSR